MKVKELRDIPEQWVQYCDTSYWISDQGRIKHIFKNGNERIIHGTKRTNSRGNKQIVAKVGTKFNYPIKDFIWEAFKGKKPKGKAICHKNGLYRDNSIYNLELVDVEQLGYKFGAKTTRTRMIVNLDTGEIFKGSREAGKKLYCSYQTILDCCNGKRNKSVVNVAWWNGEKGYRGDYIYEDEN